MKKTSDFLGVSLKTLKRISSRYEAEGVQGLTDKPRCGCVLDEAGAHRNASIPMLSNITLYFLPPYSPELNPIERLWGFMKRNYLSFKRYVDENDIAQKGASACKQLNQNIIKSICL